MLKARHIHFCIRKRPIVDHADLHLEAGEILAVLGPNGAGKSTLLKILSGEMPCKQDEVEYNGRSLSKYSPNSLAKVRSVMPQHSQLTFPFKAGEVVVLGMAKQVATPPQELLEEVMKETQCWEFRDRQYAQLSGGEKQRVQLARVLLQIWEIKPYPRYLLLDEPTSSMDIAQQHHVLAIVSRLKRRNIGVLAILHDLNLAAAYADRVALFKDGNILYQGEMDEVMTSSKLGHAFGHPVKVTRETDSDQLVITAKALINKKQHEFKTA